MNPPAARRAALRERLAASDLPVLLVTHLPNVAYLTGFTGSNGQLVIAADGEVLFTDGRYEAQAAAQAPDLAVTIERARVLERAVEWVSARGHARLGFEAATLAWAAGERLRAAAAASSLAAEPADGHVEALRAVKDDTELAALATACRITSEAFGALLDALRPGATERAMGTLLDRTMVDLGADAAGFDTIVASGPNSAIPHHRPTDRAIQVGDLVKLDFGARFAGYHADMTRTVAVGEPGPQLRSVHDLVREVQAAGVAATVAGASGGEVDAACRDAIDAAGHGDRFGHSTGHGVGLVIHEAPSLAKGSADTLAARMTVTVEPGVYLVGTGGVRIEDTLVVADSGPPSSLTTAPRELLVL